MEKITRLKERATAALHAIANSRWPHWVIQINLIGAGIFVGGLWLMAMHPASGEIVQNELITITLSLITLGAIFAGIVITRGVYLSCTEITRDMPNEYGPIQRAFLVVGVKMQWKKPEPLPEWAGAAPAVDIVLSMNPGETYADFLKRAEAGVKNAEPFRWVALIDYRETSAVIYTGRSTEEDYSFSRDNPPFLADLPDEQRLPEGINFANETPENYARYVEWFTYHFKVWVKSAKYMVNAKRAGQTMMETIAAKAKFSASVLLLILASVSAFGQKSEQVAATPEGHSVAPKGVEISYIFETSKDVIGRVGNGRSTYTELLTSIPSYRDNGGGKLLAIIAGNKSVYKASQLQDIAEQPRTKAEVMRSATETRAPEDLGNKFQLPDSMRMAEIAEHTKYEIWKGTRAVEQMAMPIWEVAMFAFWAWSPLIALMIGAMWFWAAIGSEEGFWSIHRYAKRGLIITSLVVATLFAINIYLWFVSIGTPLLGLYAVAAAEFGLAYLVVRWINPDFRPAKGNDRGYDGTYSNQQGRIESGRR